MVYNPNIHNRQSTRLKGYDYAQAGLYFVTMVCHKRWHLFGDIFEGQMILNDSGKNAEKCWLEIPEHFKNVKLHEHVVMPNHVHGILEIIENKIPEKKNKKENSVGANNYSPEEPLTLLQPKEKLNQFQLPNKIISNDSIKKSERKILKNDSDRAKSISPPRSPSRTIGSVIRGYKIGVTKWFRANQNEKFPIGNPVWQRSFHDHIIRNATAYHNISNYIINNPQKWEQDKFK